VSFIIIRKKSENWRELKESKKEILKKQEKEEREGEGPHLQVDGEFKEGNLYKRRKEEEKHRRGKREVLTQRS